MNSSIPNSVTIARDLIRCPSVTPAEAGALDLLQSILESEGFKSDRLVFSEDNTPNVDNLFASYGTGSPHFLFAGHTDVVPAGSLESWTHDPFEGVVADGLLFGRGAVDMKGAIAAFMAASQAFLSRHSNSFNGKLSILITGDEEGPAINGTKKVLEWCARNGEVFDSCIVGEPTNPNRLGDAIKIGRRGSLSAKLSTLGVQGHVAYPSQTQNPIPDLIKLLSVLDTDLLDEGSRQFQPSNLEITDVNTGNTTQNMVPRSAHAQFNVRFNDNWTRDSLIEHLKKITKQKATTINANFKLDFQAEGSECFLTNDESLISTLKGTIKNEIGIEPALSTDGGTSDARFVKNFCPVVEFGLVNQTIHQVDECVAVEDLEVLTRIYLRFLKDYFGISE